MRFPLAFTAGGDAGLFTSAPASISAFTNAAWPWKAATCRAVLLSSVRTLFTSTPDSSRALTAGTLPCSAAQKSGSVIQVFPILTKCALIFASIDRTPSTLHTVSLYALFTCAKRSVSSRRAWAVSPLRTRRAASRRVPRGWKYHRAAETSPHRTRIRPSSSSARPRRGRLPRASSPVSQRLRVLSPLLSRGYSCSWSREGDLCASPACPSLQVRPRNERCGPLEPRKRMH